MKEVVINFLDVGQGDCTYVEFPNGENMLVDCGSTKGDEPKKDSVKYLKGILSTKKKIKYIVITHGDKDHYNLLEPLVKEFPLHGANALKFDRLLTGGRTSDYTGFAYNLISNYRDEVKTNGYGSDYLFAEFGNNNVTRSTNPYNDEQIPPNYNCLQKNLAGLDTPVPYLSEDSANVYILCANVCLHKSNEKNNNSIVLMIEYGGRKAILPGDGEEPVEKNIVSFYTKASVSPAKFLESPIIKIGHHGSEAAAKDEWLNTVKPEAAFVSADALYQHPYYSTINRVENHPSTSNTFPAHGYLVGKPPTPKMANDGKIGKRDYRFVAGSTKGIFCNMYHAIKDAAGIDFEEYWGGQYQVEIGEDGTIALSLTGQNPTTSSVEENFMEVDF